VILLAAVSASVLAGAAMLYYASTRREAKQEISVQDIEGIFTGTVRPRQIPGDWHGEPLPDRAGWRWFDPNNRGNSVRFYRGEGAAPYVVVTVSGAIIGPDGKPTGERLDD
jgi:hypothetical protein